MLKKTKKTLFKKRAKKQYKKITNFNPKQSGPLRIMNALKPKIMKFTRSLTGFTVNQSAILTNPSGTMIFKLGDLPSNSEFVNLFDKFRITKVKITWRLTDAPLDGSIFPTIYSWKNHDVALTVPITSAQLNQIPNIYVLQTSSDDRTLTHAIKPYLIQSVFNGGYTQVTNKWIDMNYFNSAQYYGLGYYIENLIGTDSQQIKLNYDLEYHFECLSQF